MKFSQANAEFANQSFENTVATVIAAAPRAVYDFVKSYYPNYIQGSWGLNYERMAVAQAELNKKVNLIAKASGNKAQFLNFFIDNVKWDPNKIDHRALKTLLNKK